MSVIVGRGIARNGQVVVAAPLDVPDGTEVYLTTDAPDAADPDAGWDASPEAIAAWVAWLDAAPPPPRHA
jgi:hypothetical protein